MKNELYETNPQIKDYFHIIARWYDATHLYDVT